MIRTIIRAEGLIAFLTSLYFYEFFEGKWLIFILLILVPDASMAGYLRNTKLGSITYNLIHNYILAAILIFAGIISEADIWVRIGLILSAHIGIDRFFGFGLKYPSGFNTTHIQKL